MRNNYEKSVIYVIFGVIIILAGNRNETLRNGEI